MLDYGAVLSCLGRFLLMRCSIYIIGRFLLVARSEERRVGKEC